MSLELKNQQKVNYLLKVIQKTHQALQENNPNSEAQKLLKAIEQKYQIKEPILEQSQEIDQVEQLANQRKETLETVDFLAKLLPLKSKSLLKEIQEAKKTSKELTSGEKYYNILSKIQYIFPKPHAIAYTTTAWRTAYYKVYHPQEFYSVLLTYHVAVHDIWLMTFDPESINFRLEKLLETIGKAKNSEKELLSIVKVLQELIKGINGNKANKDEYLVQKKEEISAVLQTTKQKIITQIENCDEQSKNLLLGKSLPHLNLSEAEKKRVKNKVNIPNYSLREWKLTTKEKELLYTLKIILEMKKKHLDFRLGVDFNKSETKNFQIINGQILIPFTAITGIGESYARRIIDYRQQKGQINNWKEELATVLNKNHLEQLENLEKYHLIIESGPNI
ncbi:hypothetical protein [endosymbiont GvMRE of Glomus versiforme]|uniref:helix-hairpin-helix domain-containing protein n=1 Tax=endosymbiont GvMRE of Glomus versiforme TaxID=2039283 RepID=UPI000EC6F1B5|nr:hypothetical protein [endosymbiont GvMRE of Glomus versiforme]RHZ36896.1 DNA polymerase III PolC-type [endosymbiont GvMRE of Glomus versiforme]